jgi:predicted MFS family arabinose efflux permease
VSDPLPRTSLRLVTLVLALACGATVANLYYAQPLLGVLAKAFGTGEGATAVVVTATQLGYAVGLVLLLPLGDLWENRRFAVATLAFTALALVGAATAPGFVVFLVMAVLVGVTSVVAQVLVPLAAHLAPEERRGAVVGQVMSGLLLGILLARSVSSVVADLLGWRAIFFGSAALMLLVAGALRVVLPQRTPPPLAGYRQLIGSLTTLVREQPELRRRSAAQGLAFATFTMFWTAIAYHLTEQFGLSQTQIGLFALVGAAGALSAPLAGRMADAGWGRPARGASSALLVLAMALAAWSGGHLLLLALAAVLLDLAAQVHQVAGQQTIYALAPQARARVNSVYLTTAFVGGAIASALAGQVYERAGWTATCLVGAAVAGLGLVPWVLASVRRGGLRLPPRTGREVTVGVTHRAGTAIDA